jgi:signal-transduction protein with cAMP-binding, CBS, and nucleotidyltransferase domain
LAKEIEMGYRKRDYILTIKPHLYLIRKGAIQIEDDNERLFEIFEKENGLAIMLN